MVRSETKLQKDFGMMPVLNEAPMMLSVCSFVSLPSVAGRSPVRESPKSSRETRFIKLPSSGGMGALKLTLEMSNLWSADNLPRDEPGCLIAGSTVRLPPLCGAFTATVKFTTRPAPLQPTPCNPFEPVHNQDCSKL